MIGNLKTGEMSAMLAAQIHRGEFLGLRGAIIRAWKAHFKHPKMSSVPDLMVMANVFYSAAGSMFALGTFYKLLAPLFLYGAKWCAYRAFMKEGVMGSVPRSLSVVEVQLRHGPKRFLDFGHIQILQSCLFQWGKLKKLFKINSDFEDNLVSECARIMSYSDNGLLKILSTSIVYLATPKYSEKSNESFKVLYQFLVKYHELALRGLVSPDIVQTVIRVNRVLGNNLSANNVARANKLFDQMHKSKD